MYKLTQQEQIALILGLISVILIVLETLFFSSNLMSYTLFLGGTTVAFSLIIIYIFILQPMKGPIRHYPYNQYYTSPSFRPTIIPPPKKVKKTITRGSCEYCGKRELMGFTCSYCDGYFCTEHRLPEKHGCVKLR
ncbi:MAG: AN1-type zinc finger domain-containing protein [Promethearchaeota archaeon]